MFCLLCHEKVSRLRAWRTKSEFCCDEHAEIYKRQTLERLLTDQEDDSAPEALPLPVETASTPRSGSGASASENSVADTLARFADHDTPAARPEALLDRREEPKPQADEDQDEGVRELWRLAEEVGPSAGAGDDQWATAGLETSDEDSPFGPDPFGSLRGGSAGGSGGVTQQTPEEALAALRELSARRASSAGTESSGNAFDMLVAARETEKAQRAGNQESVEDLPASLDEALSDEDSLPPLDMGALEPLDDDELPSILDRLTESDPVEEQLFVSEAPEDLADDLETLSELEEPRAEQDPVEAEQPVEAATAATEARREEPQPEMEAPPEAVSSESESDAFDLLEEAVDSHLEEPDERPAERGSSRKVVPFPLLRPAQPSEGTRMADPAPAAASSARGVSDKSSGSRKGKGKAGDLSRVQMKPVAVLFGVEPSLSEPAGDDEFVPAGLGALPGQNGLVEPPMHFPVPAQPRFEARLPVHARLCPAVPETLDMPSELQETAGPDSPDYQLQCMTPLPLVSADAGKRGKPSLGSERAWMVRIEPELAEGSGFDVALPNGEQHTPWRSPRLPAALIAGVALKNGSGKLDLSGSAGGYEPAVDRLFLVLPELGELGGSLRQSPSKTKGEVLAGWMPPTVLDPRFDIERPAGRDLSDFG